MTGAAEPVERDARLPNTLTGKPVAAGTRITVELGLEKLTSGAGVEQRLEASPRLTRDGALAALEFAAAALRADAIYPGVTQAA